MAEPSATGAKLDVVVVGSANIDLSISVDVLPGPGETVLGGDVLRGAGGKGANQAVAAARLGAKVAFVGRVGDDEAGRWLRDKLEGDGIDLRGLLNTRDVSTGLAVIAVDGAGENSIVVASGANNRLSPDDLNKVASLIGSASVVLTQLESPLEVVNGLRAVTPGRLVLNPAPARLGIDLSRFDVVVPNRGELALLAGGTATPDLATVADQARSLDVAVVIVTLGALGAMAVFNERPGAGTGTGSEAGTAAEVVVLPAVPVTAVDTTAAGDTFCGALAVAMANGAGMVDAMGWAIRVAGHTVAKRGAQDSIPYLADVGSWEGQVTS
ncbi:MAG: ribokinase [Actinomycetia bacterium]|nr:ribokinase [Actinomycetes bacterium]MCP5032024.1 ribokinase [Actinomycetes bacterium]